MAVYLSCALIGFSFSESVYLKPLPQASGKCEGNIYSLPFFLSFCCCCFSFSKMLKINLLNNLFSRLRNWEWWQNESLPQYCCWITIASQILSCITEWSSPNAHLLLHSVYIRSWMSEIQVTSFLKWPCCSNSINSWKKPPPTPPKQVFYLAREKFIHHLFPFT